MMTEKHLEFVEIVKKKKTSVFNVLSAHDKSYLGRVFWHRAWRQYVFEPDKGAEYDEYKATIFSWDCLAELSTFIKNLMDKRRRALKRRRR